MGLQTWPPSKPSLSSMACLDVETPSICRGKFKSVLQLCLQQRRTREQLVDQGIMPPLKTPAAFHEKIRSLERARTGNFLKHKLCSRPERSELVRLHILEETQVEPSLQATQIKLKRARLADDLNEKIAQRPGPMELVEKKILPVDSNVEKLIDGGKTNQSNPSDVYNFDEDSSDTSSPQLPASQESPCSMLASPQESGGTEATYASSNLNTPIQSSTLSAQSAADVVNLVQTTERQSNQQPRQPNNAVVPSTSSGPVLVKQSLAKLPADKSRSKKSKEPKPQVKKLKYHQYIPPDQKQELSELPMDSSYARLLQQQQQFLQLQILSQQQQQYNHQGIVPATLKSTTEAQTSCSVLLRGNTPSAPVQLHHTQTNHKPNHLPANLDEMKVAELKMELKLRFLPVSGTKTDLIERLKLFQESSNIHSVPAMETAASHSENTKLTPPVSVIAFEVSHLGIEDSNIADSPAKLLFDSQSHTAPYISPPHRASHEQRLTETKSNEKDSEKDKRLHEKEQQIEELKRKLEYEQKLVEELKMQLEVEKRSQQGDSPPQLSPLVEVQVKEENKTLSNCTMSCSSPGLSVLVKQEESADQNHVTSPNKFIVSHQTITEPETLQSLQAGSQNLLPTSLPATVKLPAKNIELRTTVSGAAPGHIQTSGQVPQKIKVSAAKQQQCSTQTQQLTKTWSVNTNTQNSLNTFPVSGCTAVASTNNAVPKGPRKKSPCFSPTPVILQQTEFTNHASKSKDPPRYEDAVKQARSMSSAAQGPTAASQQMDDLFDVLIESGEISPFIRQDPPSLDKPLPVTASVTTLPINTVLSRPPPLIQVAQLPAALLNPANSLAALTSDNQLGTLLDGTLVTDTEPQELKLMEELISPVIVMDVDLNENMPPSALNMQNTTTTDSMDWLDLTLSVPAEGVNPLDISVPVGVFSSDFLDSNEIHLWD
ncbi:myocardin-related transcription factor B isoform X2 [Melanotaenia boesemani]|uniref:myocardin-related transcription factor B isoform X2 n=1 Tax=Melanotaenia boesemani TaxID=1250792 RepID=UPI001C04024A|nr:myocardin-related transcription factor B isoform X2 [Melanotaenia boesemani]